MSCVLKILCVHRDDEREEEKKKGRHSSLFAKPACLPAAQRYYVNFRGLTAPLSLRGRARTSAIAQQKLVCHKLNAKKKISISSSFSLSQYRGNRSIALVRLA